MFVGVENYIRLKKFLCESCDNTFVFISVLSNTSVQIFKMCGRRKMTLDFLKNYAKAAVIIL